MSSNEIMELPLKKIRPYTNYISRFDNLILNQMKKELFKPQFELSDYETHIGIEVEVEGILSNDMVGLVRDTDKNAITYLWSNTEDGSLRNHGREFVSLPIRGEAIEYSLDKLDGFLNKSKNCLGHEFSERTSVHVHMNARDMTVEQIASFLLLYIAVEPVLYNFCGGQRHKNIFCIPVNQTTEDSDISEFYKALETKKNPLTILDTLRMWKKYCGLNLKPLFSYGTIEFRQMVGTLDKEKLLTWINMILLIKKYAIDSSYNILKTDLPQLNTTSDYALLINNIFGRYSEFLMFSSIQARMEESVMFIKSCLSEPLGKNYDSVISKLLMNGVGEHLLNSAVSLGLIQKRVKKKSVPTKTYTNFFNEQLLLERQRDHDRWVQEHQLDLERARVEIFGEGEAVPNAVEFQDLAVNDEEDF